MRTKTQTTIDLMPPHLQAHFIFCQHTIPTLKKIKRACKPPHQDRSDLTQQTYDRREPLPLTAPTRNWRLGASYDSFVVKQTFVLRMNICGKNRQLLVAANR
jgi:hypothetical protein